MLLFSPLPASWGLEWSAAPAASSQTLQTARDSEFFPIQSDTDLTDLLVDDDGWFWLKTSVETAETGMLLIEGPRLKWEAWWNERKIAESGAAPPSWRPSSPAPVLAALPKDSLPNGTLFIKTYVREGFDSPPVNVFIGSEKQLKRIQMFRIAEKLFLPGLLILLGLILFISRLIGYASNRSVRDLIHSFFGLGMVLFSLEPVLAFFPALSLSIPWFVLMVLAKALKPFLISLWRRCISNSGGKGSAVIGILDLIIATLLTAWTAVIMIDRTFIPEPLRSWTNFDVLFPYIALSIVLAVLSWMGGVIRKKPGRIGALLILLAGIAPPAVFFALGSEISNAAVRFIEYGLPLSLIICFLIGADRTDRKRAKTDSSAPDAVPESENELFFNSEDDDVGELESYDESEIDLPKLEPNKRSVPPEAALQVLQKDENPLIKGLRAHLSPDSIPWDASWDLASTRRGTKYPATGFYDVYPMEGGLEGFSFMDTGTSDLDAMMYAQVVRSELLRRYPSSRSLSALARTVNRKTLELAAASGKHMSGMIGSFDKNGIRILPLSLPPLLLKKAAENKIITLQPVMGRTSNAPLGVKGFGEKGLRTLRISMKKDDALVLYSPTLTDVRSPSNEPWGMKRLAAVLKSSDSMKADGMIEDIVESVKDFAGSDTIGVPLQILIIKRR